MDEEEIHDHDLVVEGRSMSDEGSEEEEEEEDVEDEAQTPAEPSDLAKERMANVEGAAARRKCELEQLRRDGFSDDDDKGEAGKENDDRQFLQSVTATDILLEAAKRTRLEQSRDAQAASAATAHTASCCCCKPASCRGICGSSLGGRGRSVCASCSRPLQRSTRNSGIWKDDLSNAS